MRRALALAGACCLAACAVVAAQDDAIEVRLERVAGIKADAANAFFDALRRNVGRDDHPATCAMVSYPLAHASGVVKDAAECEVRYDAIFTLEVRKAVGKQQFDELFVNQSGVMIGNGELWFAARCAGSPCAQSSDVHVTAINSQTAGLQPPKGKVLLACLVSGQRIRISADGQGGAEFRMWRLPRTSAQQPDIEIPRAEPVSGAPSQCGSRSWTFTDGTRTYLVSDLPCDAYLSPPPMGSVGRVTLSTRTSPGSPLWCFE